jgi:hypothetical protein
MQDARNHNTLRLLPLEHDMLSLFNTAQTGVELVGGPA